MMNGIVRESKLPIYHQLYEILRGNIQNNSLVTVKANKEKDALVFSGKAAVLEENSSDQ